MKVRLDIFRKKPDKDSSFRQGFEIEARPGMVLLEAFHTIQEESDPTFSYRYSCRGAICGSCAVRINGAWPARPRSCRWRRRGPLSSIRWPTWR